MKFVSILDIHPKENKDVQRQVFYEDLNLEQIIYQIHAYSQLPSKEYFYCLPEDKEGENYRRAVYQDVKNVQVNQILWDFVHRMEECKLAATKKYDVGVGVQKAVWHMLEVSTYCEALEKLYLDLRKQAMRSEGMKALSDCLEHYVESEAFVSMHKQAMLLKVQLLSFRIKMIYENEQLLIMEETVEGNYEKFLKTYMGDGIERMKTPFSKSLDLSMLEEEIIHKFAKKQPNFFKGIKEFARKYKSYKNEVLWRFSDEITYYLSYAIFQKKMEQKGFHFITPSVDEEKVMRAQGLYDLALACKKENATEVVCNDVSYENGESILVVTGPNQGGKTTFARSLGQLVYFTKMGLDVPALAANVHAFSTILTHFSVEESVETGRGKLMDELVRLKPMMEAECCNAFVIINELFTTAANYDACIMGEKVLKHFIQQGCKGIYVTHLKELTTVDESVVSMRAMLDDKKKQSFQILRHMADDSMCAINQVNKYCLGYEQLKERLR